MKDQLKSLGTDAVKAAGIGLYLFLALVSIGTAWRLGNRVLDKVDKIFEDKEKKKEEPSND